MGDKDIAEKTLESYNDVFADIVNVLLFDGQRIIDPDDLEDQSPRSFYKADGKLREMERDVAKRWTGGNIRIACIGVENQTEPDADMPLRVIGYDGADYRQQLTRSRKENPRYPVVTLVLYFGHKKRWDQPVTLHEAVRVPEPFRPYVPDMKINLFEIAFLTRAQVEKFQSDFKIVADYFVQKRENGDYTPRAELFTHVQATLQLLKVMTQDDRFEQVYNESAKGGIRNMCDVLDRVENKGRQEGRLEGRREGRREGRQEGERQGKESERLANIRSLMETLKLTARQAMDALKIPEAEQDGYLAKLTD